MKRAFLFLPIALSAFILGATRTASARVVFTGYADIRVTPHAVTKISGSDAILSFLSGLGVTDRRSESRTFTTESIGLFATTTLTPEIDFLFDVTYRDIGAEVEETRLQYAYVHYHPGPWEAKAGRITLPIGYYNEHYFYPFQRDAITPPLYQSAIIGLPIADHGVLVSKSLDVGGVGLEGSFFVVNGYGPSESSTDTFRSGLGVTNSLLIANNLGHSNSNRSFAYGGNLKSSFFDRRINFGVSGYRGDWSDTGDDFTMMNAYAVVEMDRLNVVVEGLRTETENDNGVVGFFGARDWESSGGFVEASLSVFKRETEEVVLFAGSERTEGEGDGPGASGDETLVQHKLGVSWKVNPSVILKSQIGYLDYELPLQLSGGADHVNLEQRQLLFSLVLTY